MGSLKNYVKNRYLTVNIAILIIGGMALGVLFGNIVDSIINVILESPWWLASVALNLLASVYLGYSMRRVFRELRPIFSAIDEMFVETLSKSKEEPDVKPKA